MDILGPLPRSANGNSYLLVVADYFTRWMEAYPIPNQETVTIAKVLTNEYFLRFSPPEQLHSDQGRQFEAELLAQLCQLLGIKKTRTTPYHPQSDGLVERFNRTILNMMAVLVGEHHDTWEEQVRPACMAYNTSVQSTTGYSPFFLMFGREARVPFQLAYEGCTESPTSVSDYVTNLRKSLNTSYEKVRNTFNLKLARQKEFYDRKIHGEPYRKDDLVWLHSSVVPQGKSHKLHKPWTGPYRIIKKISDVTYRIQSTKGKRKRLIVHFDRLKACPPNMRFDGNLELQPISTTPSNPSTAPSPIVFGEYLETTECDEADPSPRYPARTRLPPDRYGDPIEH